VNAPIAITALAGVGGYLARYNAALTALADAHTIDEVKGVRDKAVAMACYATIAKNTELSRLATEIRLRAERRLGELMAVRMRARPDPPASTSGREEAYRERCERGFDHQPAEQTD
jgi:hypothetical protein